jgi:hypothetical protein
MVVGAERILSATTAGKVSAESIAEVFALWQDGYLDATDKKKKLSVVKGKSGSELPFPRLRIESVMQSRITPAGNKPVDKKSATYATDIADWTQRTAVESSFLKLRQSSDITFAAWFQSRLQTKNPILMEALDLLEQERKLQVADRDARIQEALDALL